MTALTINSKNRTIEMTKAYEKAASKFNSPEYIDLQMARRDYPAYKVVVKKVNHGDHMKGLDLTYMRKYISAHDKNVKDFDGNDTTSSVLFNLLCGNTAEGMKDETSTAKRFSLIKKWFLSVYPEVENKMSKTIKTVA